MSDQPPIGCNGCSSRWGGLRTAHCSACHRTFTAPSGFDKHRRNNGCENPALIGLVDSGRDYPCFGAPGDIDREYASA